VSRVFISIKEISDYIGVNRHKVKELIEDGVIPAIINSEGVRKYYYTTEELLDLTYELIKQQVDQSDDDTQISSLKEAFLQKNLSKESIFKPNECKVITVTNMKGGIGKTSISANIAATLARFGKRVLLVDMDSQAQASKYFTNEIFRNRSILNILEKYRMESSVKIDDIKKVITTQAFEDFSLDILPSEIRLSKMLELTRMSNLPHLILKNILDSIKSEYDFIIIDTPPNSALALEMSFYASDYITLLTEAEEFSVDSLEFTLEEINLLMKNSKSTKANAIFITKYNPREEVQKFKYEQIMDMAMDNSIENLYIVKSSTLMTKTQASNLPLIEYKREMKKVLEFIEPILEYCAKLIKEER
jgi:chromosome partitioning protein